MKITIGDGTRNAMDVLEIESYPFNPEKLKTNFRKLVKSYHEDLYKGNNKEKAKSKTREIITAYKLLKNIAVSDSVSLHDTQVIFDEYATKDMFDLWEICPVCHGSRKIEKVVGGSKPCYNCHAYEFGLGGFFRSRWNPYKSICRACRGSGRYKQKKGKIVDCYKCGGSGRYVKCKICKDTGFIENSQEIIMEDCSECKGFGKIELKPFNPVVRKGAIMK